MPQETVVPVPALELRQRLGAWYRRYARVLPWRSTRDPYRIWLSEVMLQQTRVSAVIEHYHEFLRRFPTVHDLACASEDEVLAAWSGLGYYRRARMMHRAAQVVSTQHNGVFPATAEELRALPGIGEYTSAAIASITFGESVAVLDGNVERVLLRLHGRPEQATAAGKAFLLEQAALLVPPRDLADDTNAAGDHNQAMMELGATLCLPRGPLCLECPLYDLCRTRGEHTTLPRERQLVREIACLLRLRGKGEATEVLLERRPPDASLMPGMYELPPLPLDSVADREPALRVRHSITRTNYLVGVFSPASAGDRTLNDAVPVRGRNLVWVRLTRLPQLPLTGLARKILRRLRLVADTPSPL